MNSGISAHDLVRFKEIEEILGHEFSDKDLLASALTRKAYAIERKHQGIECEHQEALATLGDAILKAALTDLTYRLGLRTNEEITSRRIQLEREESLAQIAREKRIGDFMILGRGEKKEGREETPRVLAETLEAVIGAIYLDAGFRETREIIANWFGIPSPQS
ncbi:MAG: ribonuclease III domain-containing protein [Thermoplasmata archaeon]